MLIGIRGRAWEKGGWHVRSAHRKTPVGPSLVKWGHDALIKIIAVMLCVEDNIPQPG